MCVRAVKKQSELIVSDAKLQPESVAQQRDEKHPSFDGLF